MILYIKIFRGDNEHNGSTVFEAMNYSVVDAGMKLTNVDEPNSRLEITHKPTWGAWSKIEITVTEESNTATVFIRAKPHWGDQGANRQPLVVKLFAAGKQTV